MYRQAVRSSSRAAGCLRPSALRATPRRFASTAPADKPRTWKGAALRWGLAFAAVYYYNTSPVFADEPSPRTTPEPPHFSDTDLKTVDALIEEKRQKSSQKTKETAPAPAPAPAPTPAPQPSPSDATSQADPGSPEALEEEAGQQGAFNPETGEINWDCPCLGGMAHGPCGEEFKSAFSCFVYSTEEPKGMDCIEKFQGMQDCFRKHPEVYGAELQDDEDAAEEAPPAITPDGDASPLSEPTDARSSGNEKATATKMPGEESTLQLPAADEHDKYEPRQAAEAAPAETPKKFSDATDANDAKQ